MGSRKEEERNEKIIRGLMKLPPNRRCMNCNSLGPQYVCTNFWTFVCMTCSGIHREFTHRVKSVSMAKFTSQEVEALQNGGNQRARELYLRDWDFQRQRLPDSSNVDKIRDFIKNVYVHRRYSGSKSSDKPPRDMQSPGIHEDQTRRASSYHSYSQSPPYDYQYEDRRYGKQAAALTRKPGSDKGHYEGRMSSLIYSPGRCSDHACSDRDIGFSSPSYQRTSAGSSEDLWSQARNTCLETNAKKDAYGICHPHRTTSLGSIDSNLSSFRCQSSGGVVEFFLETVQGAGSCQDNKVSAIPHSAGPARSVSLDFSNEPGPFSSSASSVDLFQLPASSQAQSVDLFQPSVLSSVPSLNGNQPSQTPQPSPIDFFVHTSQQQSATISDEKSPESVPKNEGWATFDMPPGTSSTTHAENPSGIPSIHESLQEGFDPFSTLNASIQWSSFETSNVDGSSVISNAWHDNVRIREEQAFVTATNAQPWNAFEDSGTHLPVDTHNQELELLNLPSNSDEYFGFRASEAFNKGGMQVVAPVGGFDNIPSPAIGGLPYPPSVLPLMAETQSNVVKPKSTNPFDLPFDSDIEQSNMFLDMSSFQAALPDAQLPPTFPDGIAEPWLPQNSVPPYISASGQGGLTYMAAQPPSPKLPNVQTQGPLASLGGNPFA